MRTHGLLAQMDSCPTCQACDFLLVLLPLGRVSLFPCILLCSISFEINGCEWYRVTPNEIKWDQESPSDIKRVQMRSSEIKQHDVSPSAIRWVQDQARRIEYNESEWVKVKPSDPGEIKWEAVTPFQPSIILLKLSWLYWHMPRVPYSMYRYVRSTVYWQILTSIR